MFWHILFRDKAAVRSELMATFSLSWPIVLTNLAQITIVTINLSIMGSMSSRTLAAGALGTNLFYLFMVFGSGLLTAISPLVSVEKGKNKYSVKEVRRSVRQGFWTALIIVIPMWFILWNSESIFLLMGQDEQLAKDAGQYAFMLGWCLLPFFGYNILRSLLASLERPAWTLLFGLGAIPIDAILAWVLMNGKFGAPQLGLPGIGIAIFTADSFMFFGLAGVMLFDRSLKRYHIFGNFFTPDFSRFRSLWRIGLPIAFAVTFETSIFNIAAFTMAKIGTNQMAAHAIVMQISSITFMVPFGIAQAATVRVGRAWGAGDYLAMARAGWLSLFIGVVFMGLMACVMVLMPNVLIHLFIDLDLPENLPVIQFAHQFLIFAALFQIADGAQTVSSGMLRGLHDTRVPMVIAAFGYWVVTIPTSMILAFYTPLSGLGIWVGFAVGLSLVASLMVYRWSFKIRKPISQVLQSQS